MRIGVNTRFLLPTKMEGFGWYTYEIAKRLVENHPEHEFYFFFDRPYDQKFIFGDNVTPVILGPQARHPILFKIWFNRSVTKALKKYDIDVFFSPDGYLSLKTDIPQIGVIHDLNFEHHPEDIPKAARKYLRSYFPKFAEKATHIITVSDYSKQDIIKTYGVEPSKVSAFWNGVSEHFQPISNEAQSETRSKFSGGNEFFLFVGALHPRKNIKRLVEAYQRYLDGNPDAQEDLVIVGTLLWKQLKESMDVPESLQHRVHFVGHASRDELAAIMASAKVFTFVPYFEGFGIPLLEAMQSGTPVLSGNLTSLPEVGGDAVVYCNPMDVNEISIKLGELSNNEALRAELSAKGIDRSKQFSWNKAAEGVWSVLEKFNS